jgi:hypothetical protein
MTSTRALVVAGAIAVGLVKWAHARASATPVWSADFVATRPGEKERYVRFLEANWVRARRTARAAGHIMSYRVLAAPDSTAGWDFVLLTEYADSGTYARREAVFQPILDAQGLTRIDGKTSRDLTISIKNVLLAEPFGEP